MTTLEEAIESRQRICHVCGKSGTLCDTREAEIVEHGNVIGRADGLTLVADYNGDPICEYCCDADEIEQEQGPLNDDGGREDLADA